MLREGTALKVPLNKEGTALKVPLNKEGTALKVPLAKGDLGGSIAQNPQQALTRVTGVEVKKIPAGVQVTLKTPPGQPKLVPLILPEGNNLVVEILDATLADPVDPNFQIQIGEQRSRGIELDLRGELSPGLNLIASYAYTDTEITEDTKGLEGNQLGNVPRHSGNIWAVYELQKGSLQGLGLGAGVFVLGARQGDNQNNFELSTHALTNALLYYRRDNWRAQLNFENLFDVDYFLGTENAVIPGEPFTVRGQLGGVLIPLNPPWEGGLVRPIFSFSKKDFKTYSPLKKGG